MRHRASWYLGRRANGVAGVLEHNFLLPVVEHCAGRRIRVETSKAMVIYDSLHLENDSLPLIGVS